MTRRLRFATTAFALLVAGACSDSTGVTGDSLTQSEAFLVFAELQAAIATALGNVATASPASVSGLLQTPLPDVTGACDRGGSVTLSGEYEDNIDPSTGTGTFTFDFLESIDDCVVLAGSTTFTVNGAPNLLITGNVTIDENFVVTGTYTMDGAFRFTADDDRSGTCDVDVDVDLGTGATSGQVCGKSVAS